MARVSEADTKRVTLNARSRERYDLTYESAEKHLSCRREETGRVNDSS